MGGGVGEAEVPVSPVRTRVMLTRLCAGWTGGPCGTPCVVAAASSLPLPQPGLYEPCPGRSHGLWVVSLTPTWPCLSPHCGTSSGAEMRTDEKSLGFAWPFGDSCRPQPAAQTLQHRVQAAHSPATSPACPPRDTLCLCPDKPLATPPRVPLLGVPALSCLCALSALQNPAVFTTPPPTPPPPKNRRSSTWSQVTT